MSIATTGELLYNPNEGYTLSRVNFEKGNRRYYVIYFFTDFDLAASDLYFNYMLMDRSLRSGMHLKEHSGFAEANKIWC